MAHASGMASSPTLMRDVQLTTIAISSAATEAVAGFTMRAQGCDFRLTPVPGLVTSG